MSVTASRELLQELSAAYDVAVLVMHDFDITGFTIFGTLRASTPRFTYDKPPRVIDLGFRLDDVAGLPTEVVVLEGKSKTKKKSETDEEPRDKYRATLRRHGATEAEIEFLVPSDPAVACQRVELNAMGSRELVTWIERKLDEHGVKKVIPDSKTLTEAYKRMARQVFVQKKIDKMLRDLPSDGTAVPEDLTAQLSARLKKRPVLSWDEALQCIAQAEADADEADDA